MKEKRESSKYQRIMKEGRDLFWKHGFRRVSVDEICRNSGVSKMTFYRHFENKSDLAKKIFSEAVKQGTEQFNNIIMSEKSPAEKLRMIIMMKMDNTNGISREFLNDFYGSHDMELQNFVEDITSESWKGIISGFRYGQEKGWLRDDFKPEFLFYISQKIIPMLNDKYLMDLYQNPQDMIMELANFFTYGISKRPGI